MPDFYQHPFVTTIHELSECGLGAQEEALMENRTNRPITLILPALSSELRGSALGRILEQIRDCAFLSEIVITLGQANAAEFEGALEYFSDRMSPGVRWRIIWNDGPRLQERYGELSRAGKLNYEPGKGYSIWMAIGYVLARSNAHTLVIHDTDIVTYERQLLVRLCAPLVRQELGYAFAKSYYARVSDRLYGRVVRLLLWPLIGSLIEVVEGHDLPVFLNSFRYPLSGEFALTAELAGSVRLPGDWGLETGLLCEVHRLSERNEICQVDAGFHHDHKHRSLGRGDEEDPGDQEATGLSRMAGDIVRTLLWNLDTRGIAITPPFVEALGKRYAALGREHIRCHHHDAVMNGLAFSMDAERKTVESFAGVIASTCDRYLRTRDRPPILPCWEEVAREMPAFPARLAEAVEADFELAPARS